MRWIFRLIGLIVVIAVLAMGAVWLVPAEKIAGFAAREIALRTGRDVALGDKVRPVFFPILGVKTNGLSIGNAEWASDTPMLTADSVLVGVELWPLLSGQVRVSEFRLTRPKIRLERAADGRVNWTLDQTGVPPETGEGTGSDGVTLAGFSLQDGRIIDGELVFADHQAGSSVQIQALDLALSIPALTSAVTLSGRMQFNTQMLDFEAEISQLAAVMAGELVDIGASINGDFGSGDFKGQIGLDPVVADGDLTVEVKNLAAAGQLAQQGDPLAGMVETVGLNSKITYAADGKIYLRGAVMRFDSNQISGDLDLTLDEVPLLTAKIIASDLDLKRIAGGDGDASGASSAGDSGWSADPLDLTALHALNADVVFAAPSVDFGIAKLGETRLRLRLDQGRLVVGLTNVQSYGGSLNGEYVVNARGGLSMGGDISVSKIQLKPLLEDMADYDRLIAAADFRLKFLTSGNSVKAMMGNLSGDGRFDVGQGEIIGFDLLGMLRNLDASYRGEGNKTIFSEISGSYKIESGVLSNDDLKFSSGVVDASGAGQVDIGARSVTYRIIPVAFSGRDVAEAGGLSVPLLITGPWANLSYRPDLQGLFDAELEKQQKELEEKLKTELDKAQKDAEQRVQEEVDKAVQKALDDALNRLTGQD